MASPFWRVCVLLRLFLRRCAFGGSVGALVAFAPPAFAQNPSAIEIPGFAYQKRLSLGAMRDFCLLFRRGEEVRLAVWTTNPVAHSARIPASPGRFQILSESGEKTESTAQKGGLAVVLSSQPQYLAPLSPNALLALAARWKPLPPQIEHTEEPASWSPVLEVFAPDALSRQAFPSLVATLSDVTEASGAKTLARAKMSGGAEGGKPSVSVGYGYAQALRWRGDSPRRLRVAWTIPNVGVLAQETLVAPRYPLHLTPLPFVGGRLPFRLENPSGRPFLGDLTVKMGRKTETLRLNLKEGETVAQVSAPLPPKAQGSLVFQAQIEEIKEGVRVVVLVVAPLKQSLLEDFSQGKTEPALPTPNLALESEGLEEAQGKIGAVPAGSPVGVSKALRIAYAPEKEGAVLRVAAKGSLQRALMGVPLALGAWVYADASGDALSTEFADASGRKIASERVALNWKGWRYLRLSLSRAEAGTLEARTPFHIESLLRIDLNAGRSGAREIFVAGFVLLGAP